MAFLLQNSGFVCGEVATDAFRSLLEEMSSEGGTERFQRPGLTAEEVRSIYCPQGVNLPCMGPQTRPRDGYADALFCAIIGRLYSFRGCRGENFEPDIHVGPTVPLDHVSRDHVICANTARVFGAIQDESLWTPKE